MTRIRAPVSPLFVLVLLSLWLLLNESLDPRYFALGSVLAVAFAWFGSKFRPLRARLHRLDVAALLIVRVFADIVRSNFRVGRIVLGLAGGREIRSGFLHIPLELRDPHGLAALAMIITSTPGTVWAGLSADGGALTLHVLDLED